MKIYNATKTEILDSVNLENGYLKKDTIITHIDEIKEVQEVSHIEPIIDMPHCYKKVIDVERVEHQPAYDKKEEIYVYIPYTESEKQRIINDKKIEELKKWFNNEYRLYNEKLTRFQALDIKEEIYDEYRNKTYLTLNDLYLEAEKVRLEINDLEL